MYWKITPYYNNDADFNIMPAETEEEYKKAIEYAQARLEDGWTNIFFNKKPVTVTFILELCDAEMPVLEDEGEDDREYWKA